MKVLGALLVILSGLLLGMSQALRLRKREQLLLEWKRLMGRMKTEILYSSRPLSQILREQSDSPFCTLAVCESSFDENPGGALERSGKALLREQGDLELYLSFARGLGASDTQGQLEHLELYSGMLESRLEDSRVNRAEKSRLYVSLGLFGGLLVCMVIL